MVALDWVVMAAYGVVVLWIGLRAGRGHQTSEDLFLGGRRIPAWAALCSMVATELSAATFIGVPELSFKGDWWYLQYAIGTFLARVVLATWFLSLYYRLRLVTVYGFMEQRFGRRSQLCSAWFFLVGRTLASGSRLYIASLAFAAVTGLSMEWSIVMAGLLAGTYTLTGGIRAVIWTDTLQGAVFIVSAIVCCCVVVMKSGTDLSGIWSLANDAQKTTVFHLPSLFQEGTSASEAWGSLVQAWEGFKVHYLGSERSLVVAVLGGFFLTMATHGTDQDMVQRLLTTRDSRRGGRALIGSGLAIFPVVSLFLLLGTAFWVFYSERLLENGMWSLGFAPTSPGGYSLTASSDVFPVFVFNELPDGLRGLVFSGLFAAAMSSMDSALNSLATTWIVDIRRGGGDGAREVRRIKVVTLVFAVLLVGSALLCSGYKAFVDSLEGAPRLSLISLALSVMTIVYGGLLGAFLTGLLTRNRGTDASVMTGMVVSGLLGFFLFLQPFLFERKLIEWPWWIVLGTIVSFSIGCSVKRR